MFLQKTTLTIVVAAAVAGCAVSSRQKPAPTPQVAKIQFRLDTIRPDGLRGPPDGLVSVAYEFCVPANEAVYQEVRRIDPGVQIYFGSRGRIGCSTNQALCIGETHKARWRAVLYELSSLPYIAEIREAHFE